MKPKSNLDLMGIERRDKMRCAMMTRAQHIFLFETPEKQCNGARREEVLEKLKREIGIALCAVEDDLFHLWPTVDGGD